ncbi:CGNR zinc finger domain-containing protein [Pararhodospirillum photometricum]|nr:ABATE domain-containing protein [Pararhodospirillum photometricum]
MKTPQEFRFNAGRLALDLPATVRRRASTPMDVLASPGAPARWLREAGLVAELLPLSEAQETALRRLRETIWTLADAVIRDAALPSEAVDHLNAVAARPVPIPQLEAASLTLCWRAADPVEAALATIARDALDLLGGPLRPRIKACGQPDCQMLFLDTSPSVRRRWCSMDRCGSRAKGGAFRQRQKDTTPSS